MKKLLIALAAAFIAVASYGQGQVVFANRVTGVFDAPVTVTGSSPLVGPGPSFVAQLFLQGANGLQALGSPIAFRAAGAGAAAIADRYWTQAPVDVPLTPAAEGTFVVRAWATALGSFDAAKSGSLGGWGESAAFKVAVGGGTLPAANLTTLTAFSVLPVVPEPSVIALAFLGGSALLLRRRK